MCAVHLNHLPSPSGLLFHVHHESTVFGVPCFSSAELISGSDQGRYQPSRSQEDVVSNWEPTHSLVEDAISEAEITPCLPAPAVTHMSLCLQRASTWSNTASSPLVLAQSLFCEWPRLLIKSELFPGKFFVCVCFSLTLF